MLINLLVWTILVAFLIGVQSSVIKTDNDVKKTWTLSESLTSTSMIKSFNGTWISDNEFYYTASDKSIRKYNVETKETNILVAADILAVYTSGSTFTLSPDYTKILVRYGVKEIFRHSYIANYDIVDLATRNITKIHNGEKLQFCIWSPINDRLSYVYENNVFIHFENHVEKPLTEDGVDGIFYNGVPDWVYEEEVLSSGSAMWWSKDGNYLSFGVFDDSQVETFTYYLYGEADNLEDQYPKEVNLKYPKSGTANPKVKVRVFDLTQSDNFKSVTLNAPEDIVTTDHILQNLAWTDNTHLLITWLNRRQNIASLQLCSVTGDCSEVKRIEEPKGWIIISSPICLSSGNNCIFSYWIDNWYKIWNLDFKTGSNTWESSRNFTVIGIYGYDEINNKVYYQATLPARPEAYHVFSNDECLSCDIRDVDGELCTHASIKLSKNYSFYSLTCSGPNPSYTKIHNAKNNVAIKDWVMNESFRKLMNTKLMPSKMYMNVTLADGSRGYAQLHLPPNFQRTKKYPLIVNVYAGPNSVRVTSAFALGYPVYITTTADVIHVSIDGRGTGNKGKDLLFSVNNILGVYEVEDQIFVTKYLQDNLPYIDRDRTAIWGWSYGGYMTARTLAQDSKPHVFQCGVSVAPVTSWLYYDTIYTERYMGLPTEEDNLANYVETSVLNNIDNFRTHDFLLVHGSGDDNVHYQQSLLFARVLQTHDIPFEQMTYTDEAHSISNFQIHLYNTIGQFWNKCLKLNIKQDSTQG